MAIMRGSKYFIFLAICGYTIYLSFFIWSKLKTLSFNRCPCQFNVYAVTVLLSRDVHNSVGTNGERISNKREEKNKIHARVRP